MKVFLAICFFIIAFGYSSQTMEITVLDSVSALPIPGCNVSFVQSDQIYTTDTNGRVSFIPLGKDLVSVKLTAPGYRIYYGDISLNTPRITLRLKANHLNLHEVSVSSGTTMLKNKNPFHIESRKLSDLNAISTVNLGEILGKIPGVYSASLGNGISKPVIRGMQGMRIVTLLNGLRLEGQQWGGDHGIGLTSLGISGVEVIKGPASLLYGADALGGVVYLVDAPFAPHNSRAVDATLDAFSNSLGGRTQVMLRETYRRFRWLAALNYSNHADFQLPNGRFAKNSRFNDLGAKMSLSYSGDDWLFALRYTMSHSTSGIPGHTHDSTATPSTFQVAERGRFYELPAQFFQNHLMQFTANRYPRKSELSFMVGATSNRLIEFDEKVTVPSLSMLLLNGIVQAKWIYKPNSKVRWTSGFQGMLQNNSNASNASDTLIPNAQVLDAGVYSSVTATLGNWNIQGGVRYDFRGMAVDFAQQKQLGFHGLNGAFGAVWSKGAAVLRTNLSTGFRAPHITELFSDGYHHGALRYEVGKADLIPEKASQLDLTLEWNAEHSVLTINPFANYVRDYIFLQPLDSLMDGIPMFSYVQNNRVLFSGVDVGYHFHPHFAHGLHWEISASYLTASALGDSSVSLIPQPRLMNTLRYELPKGGKIRLQELLVQSTLLGPQNNVAFNESTSKAYHVLDVALAVAFGNKDCFVMRTGVRNLLNTTYIDHLSRLKNIQMPFPGRNIFVSLTYALTRNLKSQIP